MNRLNKILKTLEEEGYIDVKKTAKTLNVTEMTIYRDLKELGNSGKIEGLERGVICISKTRKLQLPNQNRFISNEKEKEIIVKKASNYINEGDTIFLDGSTTASHLAKWISQEFLKPLSILTISPTDVIFLLKNKNLRIICAGGYLDRSSVVFYDDITHYLENININSAFISCEGFSITNGYTAPSKDAARFHKNVLKYCDNIYMLADSSKYNRVRSYTWGSITAVSKIITDNSMTNKQIEEIKATGIEIE